MAGRGRPGRRHHRVAARRPVDPDPLGGLNRALRAAFDGAHHFGVEVFEPDTASTLLAALLVHDLNTAPVPAAHPWQDEARTAVHGGLWRTPYAPRSVLGIAALRGLVRL